MSSASAAKRKRGAVDPPADDATAPAAAAAASSAAAPAPASASKGTRASSRSAAKNYLNQLFADEDSKAAAVTPKKKTVSAKKKAPAAAAAAAAPADSDEQPQAKKKKVAASKSSKSGESASSASASSSSSGASAPKSKSSSSVPPFPLAPTDSSFPFDASAPLPRAATDLLRAIWAESMTRVDSVYGGGKNAGKHQYIANACRDVGDSFLEGLEDELAAALAEDGGDAAATAEGPLLENPVNAALRAQLARVSAVKAQQEKDISVWTEQVARLEAEAAAAQAQGPLEDVPLTAEEQAFLDAHRGGELSQMVARVVTKQRVKGDASLHALEQLKAFIAGVTADQRAMSARINAEEKKVYGAAVDDPRDLIAMLTGGGGGGDEAPAAAASSS